MRPGQPSATALVVAASVVREGAAHALPRAAIDVARQALAQAAAQGPCLAALARHGAGRWLLAAAESAVLPGLAAHHCARKSWLWDRLQRPRVLDGPVVWAGVGFDGLGRALQREARGATVIETDHADTLRHRRALPHATGIRMEAVDLPGQVDALAVLCSRRAATIVCEGVLMYLPAPGVMRMLRRLTALESPPRLLFSVLDTPRAGGRGFHRPAGRVARWLDHRGEPFRWRAGIDRVRWALAGAGYVVTAHWDGAGFGEYAIEAEARSR